MTKPTTELSLYFVTWNVVTKPPQEDLHDVLGLSDESIRSDLPDMYIIGLQEVKAKPHSILMDTLFEVQWVKEFRSILTEFDYVKVRVIRLQGLLQVIFVKREHLIQLQDIQTEYTRTGLGGVWGNKGAVTIRMYAFGCSLCFVNSHLAAHDVEIKARIEDYNSIIDAQMFKNPETENILFHDYVFWIGDLNFRIDHWTTEQVLNMTKHKRYKKMLANDQLISVMKTGLAFSEFVEGPINFAPTYKFVIGENDYDTNRKPAWTDRVLYKVNPDVYDGVTLEAKQKNYRSHPGYISSDHKPVTSHFKIKVFNTLPDRYVQFAPISQWQIGREQRVMYHTLSTHKPSQWDWIGLYKVDFTSLDDYVAYVWASGKGDPAADPITAHQSVENFQQMAVVTEEISPDEKQETPMLTPSPDDLDVSWASPESSGSSSSTSNKFPGGYGGEQAMVESHSTLTFDDTLEKPTKPRTTSNVPGYEMVRAAASLSGVCVRRLSQSVTQHASQTLHVLSTLFQGEAKTKYTVVLPELLTSIPGRYCLLYLSNGLNDVYGMSEPFEIIKEDNFDGFM